VLTGAMLERVAAMLARRTRWLAGMTRRRWAWMRSRRLVGIGVVLLAIGLALPLPIPGSNFVFLIPLFVYAVGLLECDGVWIALGHLGTLIDLGLLVAFGGVVAHAVERIYRWVV
jgi:hypothetical protein